MNISFVEFWVVKTSTGEDSDGSGEGGGLWNSGTPCDFIYKLYEKHLEFCYSLKPRIGELMIFDDSVERTQHKRVLRRCV